MSRLTLLIKALHTMRRHWLAMLMTLPLVLILTACGDSTSSSPDRNSSDGNSSTSGPPPDDNNPPDDPPDDPPTTTSTAQVRVLSNRPDLISGDDVLVEVRADTADDITNLMLTRNGTDVTDLLEATADDPLRLLGTIDGLTIGSNTLSVENGNSVMVINHPKGGPVFTGPQIQPWVCNNANAEDQQCNQPVEISFLYKSTDPDSSGFQDYDPNNPPDDVADTTTTEGETVPFIVRKETGYQARDQYVIFTLHKIGESWTPANPQSQWNGRLLVTHGGNCRGNHSTSSARTDDYAGTIPPNPAIPNSYETALGLGWSTLSTAQLNLGHNCNVSYQAESLMMAKERFIEQYGELRYTVGTGCSGGAITQNMIANAYPGLYQALLTTCTYPDVMSTATQFADYHILLRYFDFRAEAPEQPEDFQGFVDGVNNIATAMNARDGTPFTVQQMNAIYDHQGGVVNASLADSALFSEAVDPQSNCGGVPNTIPGDASTRYNPETNPAGVRCDVLTFMENMVGARERLDAEGREKWSQNEIDLNQGFAGYPLGNQGVQYGLIPLREGIITPEQFLALNTNIGGLDADLNVTTTRLEPDAPALPNAYRTGILNTIVNMDTVPIINMTGPDPGAAHDAVHGYWLRYRFEREFGHRDNFVMWGGPTVLIGDPNFMNESLIAMTGWLDAIEADTSDQPLADKIIANKNVTDKCRRGGADTNEMCTEEEMTVFGTPRTAAGDDIFGDMVQCVLRPFDRNDDYGLGNDTWGDAEWEQLEAAFTTTVDGVTGPFVCDYSQKPIGWTPTITWLTYQDELGQMITGGVQMEPADFPPGWASEAFHNTWEPGWQ